MLFLCKDTKRKEKKDSQHLFCIHLFCIFVFCIYFVFFTMCQALRQMLSFYTQEGSHFRHEEAELQKSNIYKINSYFWIPKTMTSPL